MMKLTLIFLIAGFTAAFTTSVAPRGRTSLVFGTPDVAISQHQPTATALNVASLEDSTIMITEYADSPKEFVSSLLNGLLRDPNVDHSMRWVLNSSTHKWRSKIYDAIGAPSYADETKVSEALATAMRNPNNQFAILLGMAEDYTMDFSSDIVDLFDGKCWLECRLYDEKDGELLVVSGWELQRNPISGGWLIDRIDWQDFRDQFYPGLGREEWARAFV